MRPACILLLFFTPVFLLAQKPRVKTASDEPEINPGILISGTGAYAPLPNFGSVVNHNMIHPGFSFGIFCTWDLERHYHSAALRFTKVYPGSVEQAETRINPQATERINLKTQTDLSLVELSYSYGYSPAGWLSLYGEASIGYKEDSIYQTIRFRSDSTGKSTFSEWKGSSSYNSNMFPVGLGAGIVLGKRSWHVNFTLGAQYYYAFMINPEIEHVRPASVRINAQNQVQFDRISSPADYWLFHAGVRLNLVPFIKKWSWG